MFKSINYQLLIALLVAVGATAPQAIGQSTGYTSTLMRSLQNQNSVARFSTDRIQRQNVNRSVSPIGVAGVNQPTYGLAGHLSTQQKPFANLQQGPSVSPYLALSNPFSSATDYYAIVKPMQEQRRVNERVAQQQYVQARRLNQIAAQGPYSVGGDDDSIPTGHTTTRMYFGNYMTTGNYFAPPLAVKKEQ